MFELNWLKARSFGMSLVHLTNRNEANGGRPTGWYVASRLLGSPAHQAGIYGNYIERLIAIDGTEVVTKKDLENLLFAAFCKTSAELHLRRSHSDVDIVVQLPVYRLWFWKKIPVYPLQNLNAIRADVQAGMVTMGMAFCPRTGYIITTSRLSEGHLERVFA